MAAEGNVDAHYGVERSPRRSDRDHVAHLIAALAAQQHGVVSRPQLAARGRSLSAIDHWVQRGRLQPVHRGVYAVGHGHLSREGRWMAAVLAAGPGAALTHWAAIGHLGLLSGVGFPVDVTVPRRLRPRPGLRPHRVLLPPDELTIHEGIPVTTVARALFDLAAVAPPYRFEKAAREAQIRRLGGSLSLPDLLARYPGYRGAAVVRAKLAAGRIDGSVTLSDHEDLFLDFLDRRGLPRPLTNYPIELGGRWIKVDCAWPAQRLVVELDGRTYHDDDDSFENDRDRDRALDLIGWHVFRITWRQLHAEPDVIARQIRAALARGER